MSQITLPFLPAGLTLGVDIFGSDLSSVESGVALTQVGAATSGSASYEATIAHTGRLLFLPIDLGNGGAAVEAVPRVRTIVDGENAIVLTGLDEVTAAASSTPPPPFNPNMSDDDLFSTGWLVTFGHVRDDVTGYRENDVPITVGLTTGPGLAGNSFDTQRRTVISKTETVDGVEQHGYVEIPGLRRGARYTIARGGVVNTQSPNPFATRSATATGSFVVPDAPSFSIVEVLGQETQI